VCKIPRSAGLKEPKTYVQRYQGYQQDWQDKREMRPKVLKLAQICYMQSTESHWRMLINNCLIWEIPMHKNAKVIEHVIFSFHFFYNHLATCECNKNCKSIGFNTETGFTRKDSQDSRKYIIEHQ